MTKSDAIDFLHHAGKAVFTILTTTLIWTSSLFSQSPEGAIAFQTFDRKQIRLIEADGSNDRLLWQVPNPDDPWTVTGGPEWNLDGTRIAFTSDFDLSKSLYQSDLYTIESDGGTLQRVTNGPNPEDLDNYPKGSVTFEIVNFLIDRFVFFIYVAGAPEVVQVSLSNSFTETITIDNVADFGEGVNQFITVHSPPFTFVYPATYVDVKPGENVTALSRFEIHSVNGFQNYGAYGATWSSDGQSIGYQFSGGAAFYMIDADAAPNSHGIDILKFAERPPELNFFKAFEFSPLPSEPDRFLYMLDEDLTPLDDVFRFYTGHVGDSQLPESLGSIHADNRFFGLTWLPDASGFLTANAYDFLQHTNIRKFDFATNQFTDFLDFQNTWVGGMDFSPDGEYIVYEKVSSFGEFYEVLGIDLWIMKADGTDQRLLAQNATAPSWGIEGEVINPPGGANRFTNVDLQHARQLLWTDGNNQYIHGRNGYNDRAKASALTLPSGLNQANLTEVNVWFSYKKSGLTGTYDLEIYNGNPLSGPTGAPLHKQTFSFANVQADEDNTTSESPTRHQLSAPLTVGKNFFVAVNFGQYDEAAQNTVAVAATDLLGRRITEDWEMFSNGAWSNMSDAWTGDQGQAGTGTDGWHMWMEAITGTATSVKNFDETIPDQFILSQNFPNPFNPTTKIRYALKEQVHVLLKVFDVAGREAGVLVDAVQTPGSYETIFDGKSRKLASGVYFYVLEASVDGQVLFSEKKKMILVQ